MYNTSYKCTITIRLRVTQELETREQMMDSIQVAKLNLRIGDCKQ